MSPRGSSAVGWVEAFEEKCRSYLKQQEALRLAAAQKYTEIPEEVVKRPVPLEWSTEQIDKFLALYDAQDARLVAKGFPPTSRWWRRELERWLRRKTRRWNLRVGRRGGKSSTLTRVLVCWGLSGMWTVSPGDYGTIPLLSINVIEAGKRLVTIKAVLGALGVEYRSEGSSVKVEEIQLEFRVYAATNAVVGMTSIAYLADEMSRWDSNEASSNPAQEVVSSLRPSLASQPLSFEIWSSSPWSEDDFHAVEFDKGDTAHQTASYAPTWVANDNWITEARTHELEPDEKKWQREYKAVPGSVLTKAFHREHVERCFTLLERGERNPLGWVSTDASQGRHDDFAWGAGVTTTGGQLVLLEMGGWGVMDIPAMEDIAVDLRKLRDKYGASWVWGDQLDQKGLNDALARESVAFKSYPWSEPSKELAFTYLRRLMREERLVLCSHAKLRQQMISCNARLLPTGKVRYETNGLDYLSVIVTAAHAINAGDFRVAEQSTIDWDMMEAMQGIGPAVFG